MECKKCQSKNVRLEAKGITEYHDAAVKIRGSTLANGRFMGVSKEFTGSYYLDDVWVICNECGETRQLIREGEYIDGNGEEDDQLFTDMDNYVKGKT